MSSELPNVKEIASVWPPVSPGKESHYKSLLARQESQGSDPSQSKRSFRTSVYDDTEDSLAKRQRGTNQDDKELKRGSGIPRYGLGGDRTTRGQSSLKKQESTESENQDPKIIMIPKDKLPRYERLRRKSVEKIAEQEKKEALAAALKRDQENKDSSSTATSVKRDIERYSRFGFGKRPSSVHEEGVQSASVSGKQASPMPVTSQPGVTPKERENSSLLRPSSYNEKAPLLKSQSSVETKYSSISSLENNEGGSDAKKEMERGKFSFRSSSRRSGLATISQGKPDEVAGMSNKGETEESSEGVRVNKMIEQAEMLARSSNQNINRQISNDDENILSASSRRRLNSSNERSSYPIETVVKVEKRVSASDDSFGSVSGGDHNDAFNVTQKTTGSKKRLADDKQALLARQEGGGHENEAAAYRDNDNFDGDYEDELQRSVIEQYLEEYDVIEEAEEPLEGTVEVDEHEEEKKSSCCIQ